MILSTSATPAAETERICLTTLDQLTHAPDGSSQGIGRLKAMVGASNFSATPLGNGDVLTEFSFKLCRRFNRCQITYRRSQDTYDFRLARVKRDGTYASTDLMEHGVYADSLARLFTAHTGLDTHF